MSLSAIEALKFIDGEVAVGIRCAHFIEHGVGRETAAERDRDKVLHEDVEWLLGCGSLFDAARVSRASGQSFKMVASSAGRTITFEILSWLPRYFPAGVT